MCVLGVAELDRGLQSQYCTCKTGRLLLGATCVSRVKISNKVGDCPRELLSDQLSACLECVAQLREFSLLLLQTTLL